MEPKRTSNQPGLEWKQQNKRNQFRIQRDPYHLPSHKGGLTNDEKGRFGERRKDDGERRPGKIIKIVSEAYQEYYVTVFSI
jgi:hypothetical protein